MSGILFKAAIDAIEAFMMSRKTPTGGFLYMKPDREKRHEIHILDYDDVQELRTFLKDFSERKKWET
jgi:hypothetical protein